MRGRAMIAGAVILLLIGGLAWWWVRGRSPAPMIPAATTGAVPVPAGPAEVPAPCDPVPTPPPLPATLALPAPTVAGVVQALDAALGPEHKAFLLCFPDEDALVARAHFGFGRWLRTALRLRQNAGGIAELRDQGVVHPEDISAVLVRVYSRSLRKVPLDLPDAIARTRTMAAVPGAAQ